MSETKNRLSDAIVSAVEKTLNSATEATSPHPEEYWYNLSTGETPGKRTAAGSKERAPSALLTCSRGTPTNRHKT